MQILFKRTKPSFIPYGNCKTNQNYASCLGASFGE